MGGNGIMNSLARCMRRLSIQVQHHPKQHRVGPSICCVGISDVQNQQQRSVSAQLLSRNVSTTALTAKNLFYPSLLQTQGLFPSSDLLCSVDQTRSFATSKKNKKGGKQASKGKKVEDRSAGESGSSNATAAALQHEEWVKFQQSISVDGFETGQTTSVISQSKRRGGKRQGRNKLQEDINKKLLERQRLTDVGGGQYPPLRYSDEETERLLQQAYAAVPERAGKRGTRNLKRQEKRWFLVRKVRAKYKYHMANHQTRKMEQRSIKVKQVKEVLQSAPTIRETDRQYQARIFQRWMEQMSGGAMMTMNQKLIHADGSSGSTNSTEYIELTKEEMDQVSGDNSNSNKKV